MRKYEEIIREAKLTASSPEAVATYLEDRAKRLMADSILNEGDEELEKALLELNHPLIDLALAKYCQHSVTTRALFFKEPTNLSLKLCVLSNQTIQNILDELFPTNQFHRDKASIASYLAHASDEELNALFENPKIGDIFLKSFLKGDECWKALSEAKQFIVLYALSKNIRMKTPYDRSYWDGFAEIDYCAVFDAAWKLAETAPNTPKWASVLNFLYDKIQLDSFPIKEPTKLINRWFPQDPESIKREEERTKNILLSDYQSVRKNLAKLTLSQDHTLTSAFIGSEDIALRCAVYAYSNLSLEQINSFYAKDGEHAFYEMLDNENLWKNENTRNTLYQVAHCVSDNNDSDLLTLNIFNSTKRRFIQLHPEWFKDDEDYNYESSNKPASKGDIEAVILNLSESFASFDKLQEMLGTITNRVGFIWWFSLGTLVGIVSRYFY